MSTSILLYIFVGLIGALLGVGLYEVMRRLSVNTKRAQEAEQSRQAIQNESLARFTSSKVAGVCGVSRESDDGNRRCFKCALTPPLTASVRCAGRIARVGNADRSSADDN